MAMNEAKRRMIEYKVSQLGPNEIEAFLRNACEANFEPGLSLPVLEAFVAKCSPAALTLLQQRLTERGSTAGLARIQAIINNDPNRT